MHTKKICAKFGPKGNEFWCVSNPLIKEDLKMSELWQRTQTRFFPSKNRILLRNFANGFRICFPYIQIRSTRSVRKNAACRKIKAEAFAFGGSGRIISG
jgi:hypothetical protein